MESVIKQLVKIGHGMGAEVANDEPAVSKLLVELSSALDVQYERANALEAKCAALAAENAALNNFVKTCFHAAGDGCDMDGNDIQELGERLGLFGRETYQPTLHGYICGHEAGEDTVYVMNKTPATGAYLAEVRVQGVEMFAEMYACEAIKDGDAEGWKSKASNAASEYAAQLRREAAQ